MQTSFYHVGKITMDFFFGVQLHFTIDRIKKRLQSNGVNRNTPCLRLSAAATCRRCRRCARQSLRWSTPSRPKARGLHLYVPAASRAVRRMDSAGELAHMDKPKKDIARYLLEHGADVNYRPAYTYGRSTSRFCTARSSTRLGISREAFCAAMCKAVKSLGSGMKFIRYRNPRTHLRS